MISWFKRLAAPVAAVALFGLLPAAAQADSVQFYTVVTFTSAGSGATLVSPTQIKAGNDTLTAAGAPELDVLLLPTGTTVSFGSFTPSTVGIDFNSFVGSGVQIDIFQVGTTPGGPAPGQGSFVGSATGTIGAGAFDSLTLDITSATSFILPTGSVAFPPGVWYSIKSSQDISANPSSGLFNIAGKTSAVPLPGVAWAGMALLGGLGGLKRLRRRTAVAA